MEPLGETDQALDTLWRGLYGEPLPLRGASLLALRIILETERPSCQHESTTIAQPGDVHFGAHLSIPRCPQVGSGNAHATGVLALIRLVPLVFAAKEVCLSDGEAIASP
jgi:hypothetical protein